MDVTDSDMLQHLDLADMPGHQLRRLQQIATASFLSETQEFGVTPLQFATLATLAGEPLLDQRSLAERIGISESTLVGVLDRLVRRGWLVRRRKESDRRMHELSLTPEGQEMLHQMLPGVMRAQACILSPLSPEDQVQFMQMVRTLVNDRVDN